MLLSEYVIKWSFSIQPPLLVFLYYLVKYEPKKFGIFRHAAYRK